MKYAKTALIAGSAAIVALGGYGFLGNQPESTATSAIADVTIPEFSATERAGEGLFTANCAACHGENGAGSDAGPPLVHKIYEPGHHSDTAFLLAARQGVRSHHWRFGNMAPVADVTEDDVRQIVAYVRAVQRANGIN